jgi:hypothetical protein
MLDNPNGKPCNMEKPSSSTLQKTTLYAVNKGAWVGPGTYCKEIEATPICEEGYVQNGHNLLYDFTGTPGSSQMEPVL